MAGLRLGYLMTRDLSLLHAVAQQLPEWNVSSIAPACRISALQDTEYEKRTRQLIEKERRYLIQEFLKWVVPYFRPKRIILHSDCRQERQDFIKGAAVRGENTDSLLCKLQEYAAGLLPHCGKTACR